MKFIQLFLLLLIVGCGSQLPDNVKSSLKLAGTNRCELKNVLDHYKQTNEKQKLQAAYFLIGNMADKYGLYYSRDSYFFELLPEVDSLKKAGVSSNSIDKFIEKQWELNSVKDTGIAPPQAYRDIHIREERIFKYTNNEQIWF